MASRIMRVVSVEEHDCIGPVELVVPEDAEYVYEVELQTDGGDVCVFRGVEASDFPPGALFRVTVEPLR